ncbi:MAG: hypothetical protein MUF50_03880 [Planctomycetes bacterium]|jgi:hypothetical protein|nr:hypothetical protein [Planctomycetota bacterium]
MKKIEKYLEPIYKYNYPIKIIGKKRPSFRSFLISKKNPYITNISQKRLKQIKSRIEIIKKDIEWIIKIINRLAPNHKIVSIFSYGSFIFSPNGYKPNDIDIGVVVDGSFFKYKKILEIPKNFSKYKIKTIDIFIYGRDNLENGTKINDIIRGGIIHKEVIKHETSIAYWRNVVIFGNSFIKSPNLLYNTYVFIKVNLNNIKQRLARYGKYPTENDKICLSKVANRLYELNIFLKMFNKKSHYSKSEIDSWPILGKKNKISFCKLFSIYKNTLNKFQEIKKYEY